MSPIGLLALLFGVVALGGSAVVYLYDLLEARLLAPGGGGREARRTRRARALTVPPGRMPRGVVVTVRAGSAPAGREEGAGASLQRSAR